MCVGSEHPLSVSPVPCLCEAPAQACAAFRFGSEQLLSHSCAPWVFRAPASSSPNEVSDRSRSDVKFIVGKEQREICGHRCILACRCRAFHEMFLEHPLLADSSVQLRPIILCDVQPEVFLAVMEFLYTNCVTLDSHIALEVLTSALEYGLEDLRKLCVQFITETLTVEMACEALQGVVKTQSFRELSDQALLTVLRSDRLTIDEVELVRAVREWAHVNSAVLDTPVPEVAADVVKELRLFLLSPEELTDLERENRKDQFIPVARIAEAWKFHALRKGSRAQTHLLRRRHGTLPRDHHHRYLDPPPK
ncbi:BTB/POZ domain-containing protein 19 isoform X2 [Ambystoma mexicanum]|uniref:BTB/POZ domain-containing protein 19 isoform X2 n=1 Tax=Ambystoma mexicanum TaxID=8296 RepID=UPI0037E8DCB5